MYTIFALCLVLLYLKSVQLNDKILESRISKQLQNVCSIVAYMSSSSWLLDHVIYFQLRNEQLFAKLNKFTK